MQEENRHEIRRQDDLTAAQQTWDIKQMKAEIDVLRIKVDSLSSDRSKALLWGVLTLGSAVVGMGIWIFNLLVGKIHP
jgi:hypothetical protein